MKKTILSIVAALCGILTASAEQLSVASPVLASSGTATVEIALSNEHTDLVAFQMDLTLPEGISIDKVGCTLSSRIADAEQKLTIGKLESGAYRLTSTSMLLAPISGKSGTLLTLKLTTAAGCVGGQATISNIRFSTSSSERVDLNAVSFTINTLYKVTFQYGNEILTSTDVAYGALIPLPESLNSERYTLVGWLNVPETMPARNITIYADFTDGIKEEVLMKQTGNGIEAIYDGTGRKLSKMQRGVNVLRMKDGTTRKVFR